jgi:uncharacterized membrane protein YgcG
VRTSTRRRLDGLLLLAGSLVAGGVGALGAAVYNEERIDQLWAGAAVRADGLTDVHEVIDYNFGNTPGRHGLRRVIPDLGTDSPFSAYSPDGAPDGIASITPTTTEGRAGVEIRVGDPFITVSGRHRYVLDFQLGTVMSGDALAWNAVGSEWDVRVEDAEVHLVAPFELADLHCQHGPLGSEDPCAVEQVEPGHAVAHLDRVDKGDAVTIRASRGAALEVPPVLPGAVELPPRDGAGIAQPAALAALGALGAATSMSRWVRRAGRERVGVGGPTDAAFADGATSTSERLVDVTELAGLATTDFAPPEGMRAARGGVVHAEGVTADHKVAWLLEQAIDGTLELDDSGSSMRLTRLAPGDPEAKDVLDTAFSGRDSITLGKYDKSFASGWSELGSQLEAWSKGSGMWDPAGDRRKLRVRILGFLAMVLGVVAVGGGAALARRHDAAWLVAVGAGALLAGGGWAALLRGWELRVRTPHGSALWLRIESFRNFLRQSETYHAEQAAERGVLREYTAWAVALGEIRRWKRAVEASTIIPDTAGLHYVAMAPVLSSSTSSASTAPSSSGSGGGGGGGGSGGGGGGGGGGSW